MPDLSSFPITQRWPASHPDRLQLYAAPTPNGVKVSIMLEETGLAYEPHLIDISNNESKDPAFVSLNPNGRIPAIIDPAGPDGRPIALWESGAILLYLADKTGQFISTEPGQRYETYLRFLCFIPYEHGNSSYTVMPPLSRVRGRGCTGRQGGRNRPC